MIARVIIGTALAAALIGAGVYLFWPDSRCSGLSRSDCEEWWQWANTEGRTHGPNDIPPGAEVAHIFYDDPPGNSTDPGCGCYRITYTDSRYDWGACALC